VRVGIALLYLFTLAGFIIFGIAIAVAYEGPRVVGIVGVSMFAVSVAGVVVLGVSTKGPLEEKNNSAVAFEQEQQQLLHDEEKKVKDIGLPKIIFTLLIFATQLICLGLLLGFGGNAVVTGKLGSECNGVVDQVYNVGNPMPVEVVAVAAGAWKTVTKYYYYTTTILETVTEMMTGMESSSSDDRIATVLDLTSITVLTTVTAS
jgi:hypothetical protein